MRIIATECADNKSLQWGMKNLLQTVFFIGVDIQALVTLGEKILKKSIGMFWQFQKKLYLCTRNRENN